MKPNHFNVYFRREGNKLMISFVSIGDGKFDFNVWGNTKNFNNQNSHPWFIDSYPWRNFAAALMDPANRINYKELDTLVLGNDAAYVFMILGGMDLTLRRAQYQRNTNIWNNTQLHYYSLQGRLLSPLDGMSDNTKPQQKIDTSFLDVAAKWIIEQVESNPDELSEYKESAELLKKMLGDADKSLITAMHDFLYPKKTWNEIVSQYLQLNKINAVQAELLTAGQSSTKILAKVLDQLKASIAATRNKMDGFNVTALVSNIGFGVASFFKKMNANAKSINYKNPFAEHAAVYEYKIHIDDHKRRFRNELSVWFRIFENERNNIWHDYVCELYGKQSWDGMTYASNHFRDIYQGICPEIYLLSYATMRLNEQGLMVLEGFRDFESDPYMQTYAEGKPRHEYFENDLRHACGLLGLTFLPNQNFHEQIVFTPESTKFLMNLGMHYTLKHFKDLLGAKNTYSLLEWFDRQGMPKLPADIKSKIVHQAHPGLHESEVQMIRPAKK